jgi:hypothetical protein
MPQWKSLLASTAATIAVLGAGYAAVQWLTPEPVLIISQSTPSLEVEWNNTIARLGIDPVYPPEEDLAVGDLLAIVASDEEDPNETKNNKLDAASPILRRSVKLAHIDLREELGKAYAMLTVFPASASQPPASKPGPGQNDASAARLTGLRVFTEDMPKSEFPQAAFPSLKIQADNSAAFGVAAVSRGLAASTSAASSGRMQSISGKWRVPPVRVSANSTAQGSTEGLPADSPTNARARATAAPARIPNPIPHPAGMPIGGG